MVLRLIGNYIIIYKPEINQPFLIKGDAIISLYYIVCLNGFMASPSTGPTFY